jgi:hypothetical protein
VIAFRKSFYKFLDNCPKLNIKGDDALLNNIIPNSKDGMDKFCKIVIASFTNILLHCDKKAPITFSAEEMLVDDELMLFVKIVNKRYKEEEEEDEQETDDYQHFQKGTEGVLRILVSQLMGKDIVFEKESEFFITSFKVNKTLAIGD